MDGGDGDGAEYVILRGKTRITRQSCIGCVDAAFRPIKGRYTIKAVISKRGCFAHTGPGEGGGRISLYGLPND